MARGRRGRFSLEKSALGLHHRQNAIAELNKLFSRTVKLLNKPLFDTDYMIRWFYKQEHLDVLKVAKPLLQDAHHGSSVQFGPNTSVPFPVTWNVSYSTWATTPFATPANGIARFPEALDALRLIEWVERVDGWNRKFSRCVRVLEWLDKTATLGAVRYYWPAVMSLLPHDHPINEAGGIRYNEPIGIGPWLDQLRETAGTIASAKLLPAEDPDQKVLPPRSHVMFTQYVFDEVRTNPTDTGQLHTLPRNVELP